MSDMDVKYVAVGGGGCWLGARTDARLVASEWAGHCRRYGVSFVAVLALFAFGGTPAMAGSIPGGAVLGGTLIATGGGVKAYYAGEEAVYASLLWLDEPASAGPLFNNLTASIGDAVNLGSFSAGTALSFRLQVLDTGRDYFTGSASGNPDQLPHARVTPWVADIKIPLDGLLVGFEDIFGGGDRDYDDHEFVLTGVNVASPTLFASTISDPPAPAPPPAPVTTIPEPATFLLLSGALLGLGVLRKYRTN